MRGLIAPGLGPSDKVKTLYNFFTAIGENPICLKSNSSHAGCNGLMDLSKSPLFALMNRRLSWLTQRETLLAQNVSNADTPEFKPLDLTKESFRKMLEGSQVKPVTMARTSAGHIMPSHRPDPFSKDKDKHPYETALSGNAVVLEEQLMKVSETQSAYNLAINLYRKHVAMLKMAIGEGR